MSVEVQFDFSSSELPRSRWNVLDLVTIFGQESVPEYLFCSVDLSWAERFRKKLAKAGVRVTVTALLIKAIALAQRLHPLSRSIISPWGKVIDVPHITAGFTVERLVDGQPTVFFGTIENPDGKSVLSIAAELTTYQVADLASVPQLAIEDRFSHMPWIVRQLVIWLSKRIPALRFKFMGATFGLSSLGKYGPESVTGPCVCTATFGVGAAEQRAVVQNKKLKVKPMLTLTLGFDRRVMDNNSAMKFLQDVCKLVEGGMESELSQLSPF